MNRFVEVIFFLQTKTNIEKVREEKQLPEIEEEKDYSGSPPVKRKRVKSTSSLEEKNTDQSEKTATESSGKWSSARSRMGKLRTQHFIELIGTIKSDSEQIATMAKCFGFYHVNNIAFITCLLPVPKGEFIWHHNTAIKFVNYTRLSQYRNSDMRWRMVATNYLDLFNPVHFKAVLRFVVFLMWHEHSMIRNE